MNEIARFTTPSIWYKPAQVEATDISKIFLVLSQDGVEVLRKDITQAQISEGSFVWMFSQEDTALFDSKKPAVAKVDYLSGTMRYTTRAKQYFISESAIQEVIPAV